MAQASKRDQAGTGRPKVLVLDAHSDAAVSCVQSLGRSGDYEVHLAGRARELIAFASRYPAERYVYPDPQGDKKAFQAWMRALDAAEQFDYVLPVTDSTIYPLMELGDEELRARLLLPSAEAFPLAFHKEQTMELAERLGVPIPKTRVVQDINEAAAFERFPVYIKPARSKVWQDGHGQNLAPKLVRSEEEFLRHLRRFLRYGPVLVQEYFHGRGVGVEVLCDQGEVVLAFAHRRVHEFPLTGGRSTYRVSIPVPEELLDASKRLLRELGWHGVAMIEFKQDGTHYCLMEINGRFWGSLPLAVRAGVDFPKALLDLHHKQARPPEQSYRCGLYARNLMADIGWLRANAVAPRDNPLLLTRGRLRSMIEPFGVLLRRECWDHFSVRDPGPGLWQLRRLLGDTLDRGARTLRHRRLLKRAYHESMERLQRMRPRRLLILCHGNIYRSAFAACYLGKLLESIPAIEIRSAGFYPRAGRASADDYVELCSSYGVDLREHRSTTVDYQLINWADAVLIMDRRNWEELSAYGRHATDKAVWFGALAQQASNVEIRDPEGSSEAETRRVVEQLKQSAEGWAEWLNTPTLVAEPAERTA